MPVADEAHNRDARGHHSTETLYNALLWPDRCGEKAVGRVRENRGVEILDPGAEGLESLRVRRLSGEAAREGRPAQVELGG